MLLRVLKLVTLRKWFRRAEGLLLSRSVDPAEAETISELVLVGTAV